MIRDKLFVIFILNCFFTGAYSQEFSDWKMEKKEKGIEISYRWITSVDHSKVREMKADFYIKAIPSEIISHFQNSEKLENWQISEESNVKNISLGSWQTYLQFKLPWPFKSKDLVTMNKIEDRGNYHLITSESSPHAIPKKKNVNRINSLTSQWILIPAENGSTQVIYTSISYDKPEFPRVVADPILQDRLIKTLDLLKENTENESDNNKS